MSFHQKFPKREVKMTEGEMGQIALAFMRQKVKTSSRLNLNIRREIGEEATKVGVPFKRALLFSEILFREALEEAFAEPKKS